uniref:PBECR2 nuclease fold domain-containing protein n=1 Tax=uncultured Rikenella sp. TaxID=368003 RepID=UPI00261B91FF
MNEEWTFSIFGTLGWDEVGRKFRQTRALEKSANGEKLTDEEQALLLSAAIGQKADQYLNEQGGKTTWGNIGTSVSKSIPFMVQTAASGGTGGVVKLGANVAKKGAKALAKRAALKAAEMAANSAIQTPLMSTAYADFANSTKGQYYVTREPAGELSVIKTDPTSPWERSWKAFASGFTETFSERLGTVFPTGAAIGNFVRRNAPKALGKTLGGWLTEGIGKFESPLVKQINRWASKVPGYNGTLGEFGEELAGNLIEPVLTGELDRIPENFSKENLWQTAMSVAIMGGMMETVRIPAAIADGVRSEQLRRAAQEQLDRIADPTIKEKVRQAMEAEENEERVRQLTQIDWRGIDRRDAIAAVNYVELHTRGDLSAGAEQALEQGRKIRGWTHTFGQFVNRDTGRAQIVIDREGTTYFVRSGSLDGTEADATVFVLNAETGETKQCNAEELTLQEEYDLDGYIRMRSEREQALMQQTAGQQQQQVPVQTTSGTEQAQATEQVPATGPMQEGVTANTPTETTTETIPQEESQDKLSNGDTQIQEINPNGPMQAAQQPVPPTGRPMTADEANAFVRQMQQTAEPAPEMELTIENWDREFGPEGTVETPIGTVKMGENQFAKLSRQGRNGKLGMIKPTLTNPDIIIEDASKAAPGQQTERPSSYVFVKTFSGENGERIYYFTSVTVSQDGQEVVISNQEKSASRIENLLKTGKTTWLNTTQKQENQRSVSETQNGESVPLSDSRIATYADNNSTPLGIHSPSDFHFKDTNPGPNAQETRTIDLNTLAGQTVTLADGSQAYINQVYTNRNGFVEIDAVPIDPSTGQLLTNENGEEAHTLLDVRSIVTPKQQQQAQTQGNTQEATPAVPEQSPTQETQVTEQPAPSETELSAAEQSAQTTQEQAAQENSQSTLTGTPDNTTTQSQNRIGSANLEPEIDENGLPFVTASNGSIDFGQIAEETGLTPAPIRLSTGENRVGPDGKNHGYGLAHIEAGHGDQIRNAGYDSVEQFVELVGKQYTDIREGAKIGENQTYLLELPDNHNNTLFVQLSKDGAYWNVNSAGIFKKRYSRRKPEVYSVPAVGESIDTDASEVNSGHSTGATAPAGNSPKTSLFKDTTFGPNVQETEQNIPRKKDGTPDYDRIDDPTTVASALNEEFGEEAAEVARESLDEAHEALEQAGNIRKAIDRRRAQIKAQNEVTKWEEVCDALAPTRETETAEQAAETQDVPSVTLDPVMGDLITEEMHRRAPGTITVREQSDPKANNNFIQRYDIDGKPSGVYGIYDIETDINTEPVSFGLDEFSWRAENWDELEQMYNAYKADRPEVRSWIDDEGGAQFRDINDALEFKRFVDTQKNSKTADPVREAATPMEKLRAVGEIVGEMNRASGANAYVFNNVDELPEELRGRLDEEFERDGITWRRESYICAPQMQDAEQTRRTYIHEVGGHQNVEYAIATAAEKGALWEAIVDDIGLDGLRAWGIKELNGEIEEYEISDEYKKWQLGREALAYATELNSDLPYFTREKPLSLTVDLNQRITPETIRAILETANRYDDQRPRINIASLQRERLQGYSSSVAGEPAGRGHGKTDGLLPQRSDAGGDGVDETQTERDTAGHGIQTGRTDDTGTVSGQDERRADRAEQGALPAGETVADDIRYRRG